MSFRNFKQNKDKYIKKRLENSRKFKNSPNLLEILKKFLNFLEKKLRKTIVYSKSDKNYF